MARPRAVWQRTTEFSFDGVRYRQEEDYYVLRVGQVEVSLTNLDDIARHTVTDYRWWSHEELTATAQPFYPSGLPSILEPEAPAGGTVSVGLPGGHRACL
jgi:hypothetical protein